MTPPPPLSAKVARVRAARAYRAEREARRSLSALRDLVAAGRPISASAIGFATMTLWTAEAVHREQQGRYQQTLKAREALHREVRWSVRELEDWYKGTLAANPDLKAALEP